MGCARPAVKYSALLEIEGEPHKLKCWFLLEGDRATIKIVIQQQAYARKLLEKTLGQPESIINVA